MAPDSSTAYVANFDGSPRRGPTPIISTVSVIDTATRMVVGTVEVGDGASSIAVTPDGKTIYVANSADDTISVIDTATSMVVDTVDVGAGLTGVAVTLDGQRVYVANFPSQSVLVIDSATSMVVDTIALEGSPIGIAVTPDGRDVYVPIPSGDTVSVIDVATHEIVASVALESPSAFGDFMGPALPPRAVEIPTLGIRGLVMLALLLAVAAGALLRRSA